jgi:hypothetical protein
MAQVQIEKIIDHLSSAMRKALEQAAQRVMPDAQFDSSRLFREFRRAVGRKCSTWERVPDKYVQQ